MTFADASVLVAILNGEPDAEEQSSRLSRHAGDVWVSPVVRYEVVVSMAGVLAQRSGQARLAPHDLEAASALLDALLETVRARDLPITSEVGRLALDAAATYGKLAGHPARLNMGDCFAHACATSLGAALLYKGDDFARTDLA